MLYLFGTTDLIMPFAHPYARIICIGIPFGIFSTAMSYFIRADGASNFSSFINTLMPDAELRLTLMSSIAQDEARKISERVKFGFKRSIETGTVLGNNRIWGYQKQNGSLVINEKEAEIVHLIFELYANQRMGIRTIAKFVQILIDLQHDCLSHLVKRLTCTHLKSHRFPEYAQGPRCMPGVGSQLCSDSLSVFAQTGSSCLLRPRFILL